jgi:hypothetical protein
MRRCDWRFLLGNHGMGRTLCLARGRLRKGVTSISREVVQAAPPGSCDLAVICPPDAASLTAARTALRAGGALYAEWCGFASGAGQVADGLRRHRFNGVEVFRPWPWPGLLPTRFWVPIGSAAAADYVRNNPLLQDHPRPGIGSWILRLLFRLLDRIGQPGIFCAVGHVEPAATAARPLRILMAPGPRSVSKVIELEFADSAPEPIYVVKHARTAEAAVGLRREAAMLKALAAVVGVPRILDVAQRGEGITIRETAVRGHPLWATLRAGNYEEIAFNATEWLISLAHHTARTADEACLQAQDGLKEFQTNFGFLVGADAIRTAQQSLLKLDRLPGMVEQRDFGPWNIMRDDDGNLSVVDWESASAKGLAAMDLAYFLAYASFFVAGAMRSRRFVEVYRASLDPATPLGALRVRCFERYARAFGVDPQLFRPIPLLAWTLHSRSEYREFTEDFNGPPPLAKLRTSVFAALWREELRHLSK